MKRSSTPLMILLAVLVLTLAAVWWLTPAARNGVADLDSATALPPSVASAPAPAPVAAVQVPVPPTALAASGAKRVMQAYRFALRSGVVTLDAVQRLEGEFHRRRGSQAWMPGMWCVRVLDANDQVLAQETTAAPDEPCVVLDPNVTTPSGAPVAQHLKAVDDVMTQVRLPQTPGAWSVRVYRLSGSQPAALNAEPLGQLLASFPLPP